MCPSSGQVAAGHEQETQLAPKTLYGRRIHATAAVGWNRPLIGLVPIARFIHSRYVINITAK